MFWHSFLRSVKSPSAALTHHLPPPSAQFTAISDHPRAGEDRAGYGLQSGAAPVRIPISFRSRAIQSAGHIRFSVRSTLLLFLNRLIAAELFWENSQTVALYYTPSKYQGRWVLAWWKRGKELSGSQYLAVLQGPGLIRVKLLTDIQYLKCEFLT
jgi:hypothetical protein